MTPGGRRMTLAGADAKERTLGEPIPYVEAGGTNYEVGLVLGEFSRDRLPAFLHHPKIEEERARVLAEPRVLSDSLRAAGRRYPRLMDELRGIADGAGQKLQDLFIFNWRPRVRHAPAAEGCTTLIAPKADRVLMAHNEDWPTGTNDVFLARLRYDGGADVLAVCYHGYLPGLSASINQYGLVQALNNVVTRDCGAGVPLTLINRASLEAASIDEAIAVVSQTGRADSENFNFAQGAHAVYVETTAADFEVVQVTAPAVHTNHLLVERLKPLDASPRMASSLSRYARATALLAAVADPTPADLRAILSSHEDTPWWICRHAKEPGCEDYSDTLATILIDTTDRALEVGYGPPCRAVFRRWTL